MAKNKNNNQSINEPLTSDKLEENSQNMQVVPKQDMTPAVSAKKNKNQDKKGKKENGFVRFFKRIGRAFRGMVEELKKVTWPTFATTLKSTGVVLVFVAIFLVVLMGMDALFGFGFDSLIGLQ